MVKENVYREIAPEKDLKGCQKVTGFGDRKCVPDRKNPLSTGGVEAK